MSQPIDVEYVELRAKGADQAAADIAAALKTVAHDVEAAAQKIENTIKTAFDDGTDVAKKNVQQLSDKIAREADQQQRDIRDVAETLATDIAVGAEVAKAAIDDLADDAGHDFARMERDARDAGKTIAAGVGGSAGFKDLFDNLAQIGTQLRAISALAPSPMVALLAAAAPGVAALAGSIVDLGGALLLLPSIAGVGATSIITLVTAFKGLGEAIAAISSGDLEKIDAALQNISASARVVVKEITDILPALHDIRMAVQEAFFQPIAGKLAPLFSLATPVLSKGLTEVAHALGILSAQLLELFSSQSVLDAIGNVFASTARIFTQLGPSIVKLFGAIFDIMSHGLPFVERIAAAFGRALDSFSGFLTKTTETGDFNRFLEDAFTAFSDIWDLVASLGGLLSTLFGGLGDEGHTFIQSLVEIIDELNAFFKTTTGQEAWQNFVDSMGVLLIVLRGVVALMEILATIQVVSARGLRALGDGVLGAGKAINDFISGALAFFRDLPHDIWNALNALPSLIIDIFTSMIDTLLYSIGYGLGIVYSTVVSLFKLMWSDATAIVQFGVSAINYLFTVLPTQVYNALVSLWRVVRSAFTLIRDNGASYARNFVDTVVSYIWTLPGRVWSALQTLRTNVQNVLGNIASSAYNMGRNIVVGIVNGIKDFLSWAVDWAKYAAGRILDGFSNALRIGSPSQAARDKVGKPIMQGIGVGIQDETPHVIGTINDSVSNTLSTVSGALGTGNVDQSSSVVLGAGAVQVIFQGVVPTEQEARSTGTAIADSLSQALTRRSIRTAVRTA